MKGYEESYGKHTTFLKYNKRTRTLGIDHKVGKVKLLNKVWQDRIGEDSVV